jgi:hypothetical protein
MQNRSATFRRWFGPVGLAAFVLMTMLPRSSPAGTVAEQRARLPPPKTCTDPVVGVWRSHDYDRLYGDWTIFTLEIKRVGETDQLEGTIRNESWIGPFEQSEPGPCQGNRHYRVSMDAKGTVQANTIAFGGIGEWRLDEMVCGEFVGGYNLDNFTGTIDPDLQEFQSVNNDGGRSVNDPTVFRRVECFKGEAPDEGPRIHVDPPAFYPPEESEDRGGCGLRT